MDKQGKSIRWKNLLFVIMLILLIIAGFGGTFFFYRNSLNVGSANEEGITRYEWIKLLCETYNLDISEQQEPYINDVLVDSEYFNYIQTAVENGILNGNENFFGNE